MAKKVTRKSDKWEFTEDEEGYWTWIRRTKNEKFIASSFRAYLDKEKCIRNAKINCYVPDKSNLNQ